MPSARARPARWRTAALRHHLAGDVLRHRHGFTCWWPQRDRRGQWPVRTWLCWSWEYLTPDVATCIRGILADARLGTAVGPLRAVVSKSAAATPTREA